MSVKSKAKSVGWWVLKHGWSLGATWLIDRYVQGAAGRLLKDVIKASTGENASPKKLTQSLQVELDKLVSTKVLPTFQQEMAAMRLELDTRIERGMRRRK